MPKSLKPYTLYRKNLVKIQNLKTVLRRIQQWNYRNGTNMFIDGIIKEVLKNGHE